jgi:hypothetical protein
MKSMKNARALLLVLTLMLASFAVAQKTVKPLTNEDVVSMVKNALPEEVILNAIQANDTNFDTSADALIALKNAGVSVKLMDAMLASVTNKKNPPSAQNQAPGQGGSPFAGTSPASNGSQAAGLAQFGAMMKAVMGGGMPGTGPSTSNPLSSLGGTAPGAGSMPQAAFYEGGARKELTAERTFVAQTKSKADSLKNIAVDSVAKSSLQAGVNQVWYSTATHMGSSFGGSVAADAIYQSSNDVASGVLAHRFKPTLTYVWALSGVTSSMVATSNTPNLDVNYAGIAGLNPDEFEPAIVKLSPSHNAWRLVGATNAKSDAVLSTDWAVYSSFIEDRMPTKVNKLASGHSQISPTSSLAPGEYALVLRPLSKSRKFSGAEVAQNQGSGVLFNSAWSFTVK